MPMAMVRKPFKHNKILLVALVLLALSALLLPAVSLFRQPQTPIVRDCTARFPRKDSRVWMTKVIGTGLSYLAGHSSHKYGKDNIVYPEQLVRILTKFDHSVTIFDIGANVGKVTFPALAMRPKHRVIAVEPVAANVKKLCHAATLNGWAQGPRLTLVQGALSDRDGEMKIYVPDGRGDNAALSEGAAVLNVRRNAVPEAVRVIHGDVLLQELGVEPDIIKIDTQGHELYVLRGLRRFLAKTRNVLVFAESDRGLMKKSGVNPKDIWALMVEDLGYQVYPREAKVRVVDNVISLYGVPPLTERQFPPRANTDVFFIRPNNKTT